MTTPAWNALDSHRLATQNLRMADEFSRDAHRAQKFSMDAAGVFLDYSKNLITADTMRLLLSLARERGVQQMRDAMMAGERINSSEKRAVLHMALRNPADNARAYGHNGTDVGAEVQRVLAHMRDFTQQVREGQWRGHTDREITDIVNIGIGGSDLGPQMVCEALRTFVHPRLTMHFVSNVDGAALDRALAKVSAETTLFIVASKTFTTQETLTNANSARDWFLANGGREGDVAKHFVAVSTNAVEVAKFGIDTANMFEFWDWVGGRYSLWSAIGLSIALAIGVEGMDGFEALLAGAHAMDDHFASAQLDANMPVLLALIGVWNVNFRGTASQCVAPYAEDLHRLPAYLQQLEMESNGKSVDRDGNALTVPSCPVIWGEPGTNGQHAFFQLLHQGTSVIPVDFIAAVQDSGNRPEHHRVLLANCIAQSEALMVGKSEAQVHAELRAQGLNATEIYALTPHKFFAGNRPSNTILVDKLTPLSLGALIALYEQKTFVQGVIWGVNSFDQWGVELGKQLAKTIDAELKMRIVSDEHDGSTQALIMRALS